MSGPPMAAYVPDRGANVKPWAAVLTATGDLQYIDLKKLSVEKPTSVASKIAGLTPSSLGAPIKIIGTIIDKKRKMFLVYSHFIGSVDEGESAVITKIDSR